MKMKMKKNIIPVCKGTKVMVLVKDLRNSQTAIKIKKTKMLNKYVHLKNHSHASKRLQI